MRNQEAIAKQIAGEPLNPTDKHSVEYQLRSKHGRIVMAFEDPKRASETAKVRSLELFRVTTIEEKLSV